MQQPNPPLPRPVLPPHLAAACLFGSKREEVARCAVPPSGVLAELARLRLTR
jgi:hypothetical protein